MYPLDPVVGAIVRGSFALLFVTAGAHKLRAVPEFTGTLAGYRILPGAWVSPAARLLPLLECLIAAALLAPPASAAASLAGAALLSGYAVAMALNLMRGRRQLDCGCLGPRGGVISPALVLRNLLLALILGAAGGLRSSSRSMDWLDVGTVLVAVCAAALLYAAANGLLAVATRHAPQRG